MTQGIEIFNESGGLEYSMESNGVFYYGSVTLAAGSEGSLVYPDLIGRKITPVVYPEGSELGGFGPTLYNGTYEDLPLVKRYHCISVDESTGTINYFYSSHGRWKLGSPNWFEELHSGNSASYMDIFVSGAPL